MHPFWFSIGLGALLGVLYGASSYATYKIALRYPGRKFMTLVLGGIMVRLFVAVLVITLVMLLVPVEALAFIGTFFAVFSIGLVLEVLFLHRRQLAMSQQKP